MTGHRELWTLATLLLLGVLLPRPLRADSPRWADEQMLLRWPVALGANHPPEPETVLPPGRVSISDGSVQAGHSVATVEAPDPGVAQIEHSQPAAYAPASPWPANPNGCSVCEDWYILPAGILYPSYIAGEKEPRMGAAWLVEKDRGSVLEESIGGRMGLLRYGTPGAINPQGFQWDLEAAALLRQDPEFDLDVEAADFRIGSVLTWKRGPTATKFGYYHLSSHLGDEYVLRNPGFNRINYVRDALLLGVRQHLRPDLQIYGEVAYSFHTDGGAEPLELQFGMEYHGVDGTNRTSAPFAAINGHLREEFDFGGSVNIIAGWEWRGRYSNRRFRLGGQYYNGKEIQWSFFNESVSFAGVGVWYDF